MAKSHSSLCVLTLSFFFSPPKKCFLLCFERIPGAKHADKSVGPAKYIAVHAPDAAGLVEHYLAKAKAIDPPVWMHRGRFHGYLEQGAEGVIESFVGDSVSYTHLTLPTICSV